MIRFLLKIGFLLLVGILVYNYFFGTAAEKDQSRKVFGQVRGVVISVGDLVRSEKTKFDAGKYDGALEKLGDAYRTVRSGVKNMDEKVSRRLDELEQRKATLQTELDSIEQGDLRAAEAAKKGGKKDPKTEKQVAAKAADQQRRKEQLQKELEQLLHDSDKLMQEAQQ